MNVIDKIFILLMLISFCLLIGSLFYGFILACTGKFYSQIFLMISFSGLLTLIFHHIVSK